MATVRRHPVPADSYQPNKQLNDLVREQLNHFIHVAERLPANVRAELPPVPSREDELGASTFIAEVTRHLLSRKRAPLRVSRKKARKAPLQGVSLAAAVESASTDKSPARKRGASLKSKPRSPNS